MSKHTPCGVEESPTQDEARKATSFRAETVIGVQGLGNQLKHPIIKARAPFDT
jgi:hypothetical protein